MSMSTLFRKVQRGPDARELAKKIPILKEIIPKPPLNEDGEEEIPKKLTSENIGFLFLSRFAKQQEDEDEEDEDDDEPKVREKSHRAIEQEDSVLTEERSIESSHSQFANSEKNRRYALALATLATKEHKRQDIVEKGAIQVLLELALLHDKMIQVRCASAFASLSNEEEICRQMLDSNTLNVLTALSQNSNIREIKVDCCKAICNMCAVEGFEHRLVKENVPYTVMSISMAVPEVYNVSLITLLNLSCVSDRYNRIEDVSESLFYFFNQSSLNLEQELLMLQGFCNLSALRGNQFRLVEEGALKIVEKFYKSKNHDMRCMAVELLKNFTTDAKSRLKLLEIDIISIVLEMSHDPDEEIQAQVAKCFLFLSKDATFRRKIAESEAFVLILETSRGVSMRVELGRISAKTLKVLCEDQNLAPKLIDDGIGVALVSLMSSDDPIIQQYCTESLCALFQTKDCMQTLIDQKAHEVIVRLAHSTNDPLTIEWCSFALYQLTESKVCSFYTMETLILPCILKLCQEGTPLTKAFCAGALAHATLSSKLDFIDAIPLLIGMLNESTLELEDVKRYCAQALFNLAKKDANCKKMLTEDVLTPVVELTRYKETKVICAGIISRLSLHPQFYDKFAEGNVLKTLLELSKVDDRLTQRRVVVALSNLSQNTYLRSKLLELNPIAYIIALASERDEYLRRGCISIVCNMSYLEGSEEAIVKAGVIPTLMITSMITTDQVESRIICVKALINLMADRRLYQGLVKDGIIWSLSKLAMIDNDELIEMCAKALCRLSVDFSRVMISSPVTVQTIMRLLSRDNMHLKKPAARTITNMLLETNEENETFRRLVVENIGPLTSTDDEELNELCVICLCVASQSEACRSTIVKREMINKIVASAIFSTDSTISFAYITMVSNIANNDEMRPKILDSQLINKFRRILENKDPLLELAVAKALFCMSCSMENIPKLVAQDILPFIRDHYPFQDEAHPMTQALSSHIIACLYNLTTDSNVHHTLVCSGMITMLVSVWEEAKKDQKMSSLIILAICHLACGKTNSARMVEEGCTPILNFIHTAMITPGYTNYKFGVNEYLRCSASFRNLLSVVANQKRMIDDGCLPVVSRLATYSPHRNMGISSINTISSNSSLGSTTTSLEVKQIRANGVAALKSLTYNAELRQTILEGEGISIIMGEIRKESDMTMPQSLLKELEAESWENGGRAKLKDGRTKAMSQPHTLFMDFLKGVSEVTLNVSKKDVDLDKCFVSVHLEDGFSSPQNAGGSMGGRSSLRMSMSMGANGNVGINAEISTALSTAMTASHQPPSSSSPDSPPRASGASSPSPMKSSASAKKLKLQRMATRANLVMQELDIQEQSLTMETSHTNFLDDDNLTIRRLQPKEDPDDAMGLEPGKYSKRTVEVRVDPKVLVDQSDDAPSGNNSVNGNTNNGSVYSVSAQGDRAGLGWQNSAHMASVRSSEDYKMLGKSRDSDGNLLGSFSTSFRGTASTAGSFLLPNSSRSNTDGDCNPGGTNPGTNLSHRRKSANSVEFGLVGSTEASSADSPPTSPTASALRSHRSDPSTSARSSGNGPAGHASHFLPPTIVGLSHQENFPGTPAYQQQQMDQYTQYRKDLATLQAQTSTKSLPALRQATSPTHHASVPPPVFAKSSSASARGPSSARMVLSHGATSTSSSSAQLLLLDTGRTKPQSANGAGGERRTQTGRQHPSHPQHSQPPSPTHRTALASQRSSSGRLSPLRLAGDLVVNNHHHHNNHNNYNNSDNNNNHNHNNQQHRKEGGSHKKQGASGGHGVRSLTRPSSPPRSPNEDDKIMSLVAMINKARELQDRDVQYGVKNRQEIQENRVGELLDKWKTISRF
jgi:hypothetical protein